MGGGSQLVLLRYMLLYWDSFWVYVYMHTYICAYMYVCIHICMLEGLILTLTGNSLVTFGAISVFRDTLYWTQMDLVVWVCQLNLWNFGILGFGILGFLDFLGICKSLVYKSGGVPPHELEYVS